MRNLYRPELETGEVRDGETVHSRMMMLNHGGRARRVNVGDAMRDYMRFASHRPGYVQDSLASSTRLPRSLLDAMAERQRIFDAAARRGDNAWRTPLVSMPKENWDQRQPVNSPDDDPDDDENSGDDENGEVDLETLQRMREDAYQARNARGDSAYKNPPNPYGGNLSNYGGVLDPREADRVEAIRRQTVLR
jgi:hypothetical protein